MDPDFFKLFKTQTIKLYTDFADVSALQNHGINGIMALHHTEFSLV
jgi:hypothetical protein